MFECPSPITVSSTLEDLVSFWIDLLQSPAASDGPSPLLASSSLTSWLSSELWSSSIDTSLPSFSLPSTGSESSAHYKPLDISIHNTDEEYPNNAPLTDEEEQMLFDRMLEEWTFLAPSPSRSKESSERRPSPPPEPSHLAPKLSPSPGLQNWFPAPAQICVAPIDLRVPGEMPVKEKRKREGEEHLLRRPQKRLKIEPVDEVVQSNGYGGCGESVSGYCIPIPTNPFQIQIKKEEEEEIALAFNDDQILISTPQTTAKAKSPLPCQNSAPPTWTNMKNSESVSSSSSQGVNDHTSRKAVEILDGSLIFVEEAENLLRLGTAGPCVLCSTRRNHGGDDLIEPRERTRDQMIAHLIRDHRLKYQHGCLACLYWSKHSDMARHKRTERCRNKHERLGIPVPEVAPLKPRKPKLNGKIESEQKTRGNRRKK